MELSGLSESQLEALMEILILGMYADGHLACGEDDRIQAIALKLHFSDEENRRHLMDKMFTRASRAAEKTGLAQKRVKELVKEFSDEPSRKVLCSAVDDLLASDDRLTGEEKAFWKSIRESLTGRNG